MLFLLPRISWPHHNLETSPSLPGPAPKWLPCMKSFQNLCMVTSQWESVTWASGWDCVSIPTFPHIPSLVWPLSGGALMAFPLNSKCGDMVFFISVCSRPAQAWGRVGAKSLLVAPIQHFAGESCCALLLEGLHSFFDGPSSQLLCVHVLSVQPNMAPGQNKHYFHFFHNSEKTTTSSFFEKLPCSRHPL